MKKFLSLCVSLLAFNTFAATEYDLKKGVDLTGTNFVTYSLLNQLVDLGTVATNKGMVIRKATRPDVTNNPRYTNFLWLDLSGGVPGSLRQYVCCGDADTNWVTATLGSSVVGTANIIDYNVTESKMATNSVNQYALQGNIPGSKLADNSIPVSKLAASSVSQGNFVSGAIRSIDITNKTIQASNIADAAIIRDLIATDVIDTTRLTNSAVTTVKIADTNVTTGKLLDGAVTAAKIATSTITTNQLAGSLNASLMHTNTSYGLVRAWALVNAAGTLVKGFNIASANRRDTGDYEVVFGGAYTPADTNYIVQLTSLGTAGRAISYYSNSVSSVRVNNQDVGATDQDNPFSIVIYDFQ